MDREALPTEVVLSVAEPPGGVAASTAAAEGPIEAAASEAVEVVVEADQERMLGLGGGGQGKEGTGGEEEGVGALPAANHQGRVARELAGGGAAGYRKKGRRRRGGGADKVKGRRAGGARTRGRGEAERTSKTGRGGETTEAREEEEGGGTTTAGGDRRSNRAKRGEEIALTSSTNTS